MELLQAMPNPSGFHTEKFAAAYLGISVQGLRNWRKQGRGPRFRKFGKSVRYAADDLLAFVNEAPAGGAQVA
jgi:DNA-binding transcriptional regulator YiaG